MERVKNANRATFAFARSMLFLLFAIPLLIVMSYHIFGWKAAVSVFPLLHATARISQASRPRRSEAREHPKYMKIVFWADACVIPLISIAASEPEFMRLWALAAGVVLSVAIFGKRRSSDPFDIAGSYIWSAVPSLLFVAGSEVIWQFTSFGVWVWYHAFFVQIFVGFAVLTVWLRSNGNTETKPQGQTVIQARPPSARSKRQGERHEVSVTQNGESWLQYKNITLGQACRLFENFLLDLDGQTVSPAGSNAADLAQRAFNLHFDGYTHLNVKSPPSGVRDFLYLEWQHPVSVSGLKLKLPLKTLKAAQFPAVLIPELIGLGWEEDWESVAARLAPFAETNAKGR
jgi:hypothetical protein